MKNFHFEASKSVEKSHDFSISPNINNLRIIDIYIAARY